MSLISFTYGEGRDVLSEKRVPIQVGVLILD